MCNREAQRRRATTNVVVGRRETVDGENEEGLIWTFRVMVLGSISFLILLVLNKYFLKEAGECIMSMASTMVVLYLLGYIMAKLIPKTVVYYPIFGLEFSINPGPFGLKEYAMISILANMGATIGGLTSYSVDWSYS